MSFLWFPPVGVCAANWAGRVVWKCPRHAGKGWGALDKGLCQSFDTQNKSWAPKPGIWCSLVFDGQDKGLGLEEQGSDLKYLNPTALLIESQPSVTLVQAALKPS